MKRRSLLGFLALSSLVFASCSKEASETQSPSPAVSSVAKISPKATLVSNAILARDAQYQTQGGIGNIPTKFATGDVDYDLGGNTGYKDIEDLYKASTFKGQCPPSVPGPESPSPDNNDGTQITPVNNGEGGECTYWYDTNAFFQNCQDIVHLAEQRLREAEGRNNPREIQYYKGYIVGVERGVVDYYH